MTEPNVNKFNLYFTLCAPRSVFRPEFTKSTLYYVNKYTAKWMIQGEKPRENKVERPRDKLNLAELNGRSSNALLLQQLPSVALVVESTRVVLRQSTGEVNKVLVTFGFRWTGKREEFRPVFRTELHATSALDWDQAKPLLAIRVRATRSSVFVGSGKGSLISGTGCSAHLLCRLTFVHWDTFHVGLVSRSWGFRLSELNTRGGGLRGLHVRCLGMTNYLWKGKNSGAMPRGMGKKFRTLPRALAWTIPDNFSFKTVFYSFFLSLLPWTKATNQLQKSSFLHCAFLRKFHSVKNSYWD